MRAKRLNRMYRLIAMCAVALVAAGGVLISAGPSWAGPHHAGAGHRAGTGHHDPEGLLAFSDGQAQLRIPTPACPPDKASCTWVLFVNEPKVSGPDDHRRGERPSGTLVVGLPSFCGVVQADAVLGPKAWHSRGAHGRSRTTVARVSPDTTTTRTTATTTTSPGTGPPGTSSGGGGTTGSGGGTAGTTATPPTSALPFTATATAAHSATSVPVHLDASTDLPFTGADLPPLVLLGIVLILLGGFLLTTVKSRRSCYTERRPFVPIR